MPQRMIRLPGGNLYFDAAGTFPQIVPGMKEIAQNREKLDAQMLRTADQAAATRDDAALAKAMEYTDVSFQASAPGGATDATLDAAIDRAVAGDRVAGPDDLPANGRRAVGQDELVLNVRDHGAVGDGETDDFPAFQAAFDLARSTKRTVLVPAGSYRINGSLDISGVRVRGEAAGYYEKAGAVLIGNGTDVLLDQKQTGLDNITFSVSGVKIQGVATGLRMTYAIYCHVSDVTIESTGPGLVCGVPTIIGPIWNVFDRVKVKSTGGAALVLGGKEWCNSNVFNVCDFQGAPAVLMNATGGYGAIDNCFHECEIRGENVGFSLECQNVTTKIESCYIEPKGPSVVIAAASRDLRLSGNVHGTTVAANPYGKPHYVHHAAGVTTLRVDGGWVTNSGGNEYKDMRFVGSDAPASLALEYVTEPVVSSGASGWMLHDPAVISAPRVQRGNLTVQQAKTPGVTVQYADGSHPFTIRRNGVQGTSDYGVQFLTEAGASMTLISGGYVMLNKDPVFANKTAATTLGTVTGAVPVRDNAGKITGYLPIYDSIT